MSSGIKTRGGEMQSEADKRKPELLDGLTLAAAFRKHVIEDDEVAAIGHQFAEMHRRRSPVFLDGNFPGPIVEYHWPLHISAESIAYAFVSSPSVSLDEYSRPPSELEIAASELLSARIGTLTDHLAHEEIVAVGTFAATGVDGPIGAGQWLRKDLSIDVENSAVCELRNYRHVPIWTGVRLRLPDRHPPSDQTVSLQHPPNQPTKARKQIQTKSKSRAECADWLASLMSDPTRSPLTNDELWAEASSRWPNRLSKREFDRCRAIALGALSEEQRYLWARPGPKPRSSQF
jgi:hypothetical protein